MAQVAPHGAPRDDLGRCDPIAIAKINRRIFFQVTDWKKILPRRTAVDTVR
jgi:hypothetical protein